MHLKPGERITVRDMLYAIMLRSANDGCYAVAKHISGSVEAFSKLMNERARQVGCTRTHFHNPNGLNDPDHTTTAHDLALIARAAMMHPEFREVVKTYKYEVTRSINQHDRLMINHDKPLKKDPFAEGIKTGYTVPAGHCFVGSSSRSGFRVITVVMKSNRWQDDSEGLMSWAFDHFEKKETIPAGQVVGSVAVPNGAGAPIAVSLAVPAYTLGPIGEHQPKPKTEVKPLADLKAPVKKGDVVGSLEIVDADHCLQRVPVVANSDVSKASIIGAVKPESTGSKLFFGGALFVGAFLVRGRANKRKKYYGRTTTRPRF
jgi:D-alanyl-D-alanine carboxypeptidase (penicillin-binding protein 5/6)